MYKYIIQHAAEKNYLLLVALPEIRKHHSSCGAAFAFWRWTANRYPEILSSNSSFRPFFI